MSFIREITKTEVKKHRKFLHHAARKPLVIRKDALIWADGLRSPRRRPPPGSLSGGSTAHRQARAMEGPRRASVARRKRTFDGAW